MLLPVKAFHPGAALPLSPARCAGRVCLHRLKAFAKKEPRIFGCGCFGVVRKLRGWSLPPSWLRSSAPLVAFSGVFLVCKGRMEFLHRSVSPCPPASLAVPPPCSLPAGSGLALAPGPGCVGLLWSPLWSHRIAWLSSHPCPPLSPRFPPLLRAVGRLKSCHCGWTHGPPWPAAVLTPLDCAWPCSPAQPAPGASLQPGFAQGIYWSWGAELRVPGSDAQGIAGCGCFSGEQLAGMCASLVSRELRMGAQGSAGWVISLAISKSIN